MWKLMLSQLVVFGRWSKGTADYMGVFLPFASQAVFAASSHTFCKSDEEVKKKKKGWCQVVFVCFTIRESGLIGAELNGVVQRGLDKHGLVSQGGTLFMTWLKMCPNTIPITPRSLLSPPRLPSLPPSPENSLPFAQAIPSPWSSLFPGC